jgi:hypothetical protein
MAFIGPDNMTKSRVHIFSLACALFVAACSDQQAEPKFNYTPIPKAPEPKIVETTPYRYKGKNLYIAHVGPSLAETKPPGDGDVGPADMMALVRGTLNVANGCLVLHALDGDRDEIVVFRLNEFTWDNATETFTYRGKAYKIGDKLVSGGGTMSYEGFLPSENFMPYICNPKKDRFTFVN